MYTGLQPDNNKCRSRAVAGPLEGNPAPLGVGAIANCMHGILMFCFRGRLLPSFPKRRQVCLPRGPMDGDREKARERKRVTHCLQSLRRLIDHIAHCHLPMRSFAPFALLSSHCHPSHPSLDRLQPGASNAVLCLRKVNYIFEPFVGFPSNPTMTIVFFLHMVGRNPSLIGHECCGRTPVFFMRLPTIFASPSLVHP